jgi:hypothetical protein
VEHKGPGEVVRRRRVPYRKYAAAENERSPWLQSGDLERDLRMELDLVPDPDVLPLGRDAIRAVDIAALRAINQEVSELEFHISPA